MGTTQYGGKRRAKSFITCAEGGNVALTAVAWKDKASDEKTKMALDLNSNEIIEASAVGFPWFALQVRARQEAGVAAQLTGQGYERFLPFYKVRRRWSDRVKEFDAPLFPGYLFCRFDAHNRLPILKTPGVIQIVSFNNIPAVVDESEILSIQRLVTSGIQHQPCPFLSVGDRVRIDSGPLSGLEGILTDVKGSRRLVLSVSLLQRSVAVEIDSAFVTALARPRVKQPENSSAPDRLLSVEV